MKKYKELSEKEKERIMFLGISEPVNMIDIKSTILQMTDEEIDDLLTFIELFQNCDD